LTTQRERALSFSRVPPATIREHHMPTSPIIAPVAANDNGWDGRQLLSWPTAKRLAASRRYDDLALLVSYKGLVDLAYGTPANDNYTNPPPARGEEDDRAAEEIISEIDMTMTEDDMKPSVSDLMAACTLVPIEQAPARRAVIERVDHRTGAARRKLGGLAFVDGSRLLEYQTTFGGRWKKPAVLRNHHRNKKASSTALVPNSSGTWALDDIVSARQELRMIYDAIPTSSVRLLEIACGPTRAQEIGEAFRKRGKNAERFGVRLIDQALGQLREKWRPQNALCA
jgi:hypothetical protein